MLILLLLVVVAVVAVIAAGGAAASREDGQRSLLGGAGPPLLLLVGTVGVVVLGAAAVLLVGFRGGRGSDEEATTPSPTASVPAASKPASTSPDREPVGPPAIPAGTGPEVTVRGGGSPTTVDRLPETAVLVISASGFKPGTGEVAQCGLDAEDCRNGFPVEFGADGTARFQYLVSDVVHEGERCGAGQQPCLVVVFGSHGEAEGHAVTVFHDPAPPVAPVTIEPPAGPAEAAAGAAGPTARYHGARLAGGLALAALLLALAWRLFRRTDWREPAAAATPDMDAAAFDT